MSPSPIRTLIVDDEAPARARLRRLLAAEPDFAVVGEAADGEEAVAALEALRPDLVFLDVQMPHLSGFEVVERVGAARMPRLVFVTAFDQHALAAFEAQAFDYLLKPFAPSRFQQLLARLRPDQPRPTTLTPPTGPAPLLVRQEEGREVLLLPEEIDLVRSRGNELVFHTRRGTFERRGTLTEMAARLGAESFLQLNRAELVRVAAIREIQPWSHGDAQVLLHNGQRLRWSRRFRSRQREHL